MGVCARDRLCFGLAARDKKETEVAATFVAPEKKKAAGVLPPDGGWGWMIVAGCFMVTVCTRAVTRYIKIRD